MDTISIIAAFRKQLEGVVAYVTDELRQIRTGKASPSLIDSLEVTTYGGATTLSLRELASISTDGSTMIVIDPYDASIVQDIEKAIRMSPLGLSPRVDGKTIRILTPPLTEDQRIKFTKLVGEKVEHGKVQIRQHRDHGPQFDRPGRPDRERRDAGVSADGVGRR